MLRLDLPAALKVLQSLGEGRRGGGAGRGSRAGLHPVGELEQGLLAVDDVQVVHVGFQLLVLFRRHVTS